MPTRKSESNSLSAETQLKRMLEDRIGASEETEVPEISRLTVALERSQEVLRKRGFGDGEDRGNAGRESPEVRQRIPPKVRGKIRRGGSDR